MSDSAEWDQKVCAVQELLLQIVALSSGGVYLLDGRGLDEEMTRETIIFLRGVLAWIGKLLLVGRLWEVNVKFHSK